MTGPFLSALPAHGSERDAVILNAIGTGKLDPPTWVEVAIGRVRIEVSADYLMIDGGRVPMSAPVAQTAVDSLDALLPTPPIVEAIEGAARLRGRLVPFVAWPQWQDNSQLATSTILWREGNIPAAPAGTLIAGCLKDIVIAPRLAWMLDRVLIFGGLDRNGKRVQQLQTNATAHGAWFDGGYAHGVRAVRRRCWVDGVETTLDAVLTGPDAALLGGPVARLRYPMPPTDVTPPAPVTTRPLLRRGSRGEAVRELQDLLVTRGYVLARDGIFGSGTEGAVEDFQGERGLTPDGVVGPKTWGALLGGAVQMAPMAPAPPVELPADLWDIPPILSESQLVARYGKIEWVAAPHPLEPRMVKVTNGWNKGNLVKVVVPQLIGIQGAPPRGEVLCHRLFGPKLVAAFADIAREGKLHYVLTWDGLLNQRTMTGQPDKLSRHTFGIGFDINATWNPFKGPASRAYGSILPLVPIFRRHRITWLGDYDPMHFEDMA